MASFDTLNETTTSNDDDYFVLRQGSIDYKQNRSILAASISSARYTSYYNYTVGDRVIGSDNLEYKALITNGPNSTVVDPVGDSTGTWMISSVQFLTTDITKTVGDTGDFSNINDALSYISEFTPICTNTEISVTIELQTGFVMEEQVFNYGLNLGWVTISAVDAEVTVTSSVLTETIDGYTPVFTAAKGGTLPKINTLFNFDTADSGTEKHGIYVTGSGSSVTIESGMGVKNAGGDNLHVTNSASADGDGADFTNAGQYGVFADRGGIISVVGADASGAETYCYYALRASTISANLSTGSNAGVHNYVALDGSTIDAGGATGTGAANSGFVSSKGSKMNCSEADGSGAGSVGFFVANGGEISANNATGTLNQTANTITSAGLIYQ